MYQRQLRTQSKDVDVVPEPLFLLIDILHSARKKQDMMFTL